MMKQFNSLKSVSVAAALLIWSGAREAVDV